jgi:predicted O-methyltransferase YrrM
MSIEKPDLIEEYVRKLYAPEDEALFAVPQRQEAAGLPAINISPVEGKLITVLLKSIGAKRVLEIGTLGGYSGVWIARALGKGSKLVTLEIDPKHAAFARQTFAAAGVEKRVELREGSAREILPTLEPGFDAVFIDADKASQVFYYQEAMRLLWVGGLLLVDNAHYDGAIIDPRNHEPGTEAVREVNRLVANDSRLVATIISVRDGLLVGVKVAD